MADERKHFNQKLWEHMDAQVTSNTISWSAYFSKDDYCTSDLRIQVNITNRKARTFTNFSITHQHLTQYLAKVKPLMAKIPEIKTQVGTEGSKSFMINDFRKLVTTFCSRTEYGGFCVRIAIGEKDAEITDTSTAYLPFADYRSLLMVLANFRDNYTQMAMSIPTIVMMDNLNDNIQTLSEKVTSYYAESSQKSYTASSSGLPAPAPSSEPEMDIDIGEPAELKIESKAESEEEIEIDLGGPEECKCEYESDGGSCIHCGAQGGVLELKEEKSEDTKETVDPIEPTKVEEKEEKSEDKSEDTIGVEMTSGDDTVVVPVEEVLEQAANPVPDENIDPVHDDLSSFIDEKRDGFDLGIDRTNLEVNVDKAEIVRNGFTKNFLGNDLANLEMYLLNCLNDPIPLRKFYQLVESKINGDLSEKPFDQMNGIQYTTTSFIKYYMNLHLNEKKTLPASIVPVVFNDVKPNDNDLSVMYDMYLYLVYYSQLRNQIKEKDLNSTNNKELICFILKTIGSPLIFSYINNVKKDVLVSEILNRFEKYKADGVFESVENNIFELYKIKPNIIPTTIKSEVSRTFDLILDKLNGFHADSMFIRCKKFGIVSIGYDFFKKNNFTEEQMLKLLVLDLNYRKNGKVDVKEIESNFNIKDFSDLPEDIITLFGISEKKFDNTNLVRYVKQTFKDDKNLEKYLEVINLINSSYYDLRGKDIDLTIFPESALTAILLWDVETDKKITINYNYYVEKINESSLDHSMVLSMLSNLSERSDSDFVESLTAVNTVGA